MWLSAIKQAKFVGIVDLIEVIFGQDIWTCSEGATISSVHLLLSPETVLNDTLNHFFQRSSHPLDALKVSTFIFSANSMVLVLKTAN